MFPSTRMVDFFAAGHSLMLTDTQKPTVSK